MKVTYGRFWGNLGVYHDTHPESLCCTSLPLCVAALKTCFACQKVPRCRVVTLLAFGLEKRRTLFWAALINHPVDLRWGD